MFRGIKRQFPTMAQSDLIFIAAFAVVFLYSRIVCILDMIELKTSNKNIPISNFLIYQDAII